MKAGCLEAHKTPNHVNSQLEYFKSLKEKFGNRSKITSLFAAQTTALNLTLEASYEISLLIAKHGKNHMIGEEIIKPAISLFHKTVLQKDDKDVRTMPLNNIFPSCGKTVAMDVSIFLSQPSPVELQRKRKEELIVIAKELKMAEVKHWMKKIQIQRIIVKYIALANDRWQSLFYEWQLSPTENEDNENGRNDECKIEDGNTSRPKLQKRDSFLMVHGSALLLPECEVESECQDDPPVSSGGESLQNHLQLMCQLLKPEDSIHLAIQLESSKPNRSRYMLLVSNNANMYFVEYLILGVDCTLQGSRTACTIGLVYPICSDTQIFLDGDGGFSVTSSGRTCIFKPKNIQAMWTILQNLHECCQEAVHRHLYPGSGSQRCSMDAYQISSNQHCINEWNLMSDLLSKRTHSLSLDHEPTEMDMIEQEIKSQLRLVMADMDFDNVTSKEIRSLLEVRLDQDLSEFREFVDNEILLVVAQMDQPSQIFDFLYLGSEWNAANFEELVENGIGYILNVTREIDNFFPGRFCYMNVRVYDKETTNLLPHWDHTYRFIAKARAEGSRCLVHCKMGVSRSASTVMAFVMKDRGWSLNQAMDYVRERRPGVKPNAGFVNQLQTYEGIVGASRQRHSALWTPHSQADLRGTVEILSVPGHLNDSTSRARPQGPSASLPGPESPSASLPGPDTPSASLPGPDTPSASLPGPEIPSASPPGPAIPSASSPGPETPSASSPGPETPSASLPGPETSSASPTGPETPSASPSGPETPSASLPGPETSSASPPRLKTASDSSSGPEPTSASLPGGEPTSASNPGPETSTFSRPEPPSAFPTGPENPTASLPRPEPALASSPRPEITSASHLVPGPRARSLSRKRIDLVTVMSQVKEGEEEGSRDQATGWRRKRSLSLQSPIVIAGATSLDLGTSREDQRRSRRSLQHSNALDIEEGEETFHEGEGASRERPFLTHRPSVIALQEAKLVSKCRDERAGEAHPQM
ncbi:protein phosphatase Slingshot homolog 3-like [Narcine bancroftii]|uniref:protein phosphatase Slingshot homolog 3-like n=1 Tax=Narcine bancroftii TaxID=1343680 RepID=UPI003831C19F